MTSSTVNHKKIPLSLYIHIPWCLQKCPYCDFYSLPYGTKKFPERQYIQTLIDDLDNDLKFIGKKQTLISLFIGGGTPSLFSPQSIAYLLNAVQKKLSFEDDIEITMEANPKTLSLQNLKEFRSAGINRLSIGIQSFSDRFLKQLGRIHQGNDAKLAVKKAVSIFDNVNLDLLFGTPNQTVQDSLEDLKTAMQYSPSHLSWYQLTIEPDTPFGQSPPNLPSEETIETICSAGLALLSQNDYIQYEISNYARTNYQCRHNINYWEFGDYIGIGAGAHGKWTKIETNAYKILRSKKIQNLAEYLRKPAVEWQAIQTKNYLAEFMLNALRLKNGFPETLFFDRTGLPLEKFQKKLMRAKQKGFIQRQNGRIKPTRHGQLFLNNCLMEF